MKAQTVDVLSLLQKIQYDNTKNILEKFNNQVDKDDGAANLEQKKRFAKYFKSVK